MYKMHIKDYLIGDVVLCYNYTNLLCYIFGILCAYFVSWFCWILLFFVIALVYSGSLPLVSTTKYPSHKHAR